MKGINPLIIFVCFIFLIFTTQSVYGLNASSENYSVSRFGTGLATSNSSSENYSSLFLAESAGTTRNAANDSYTANIGFFNNTLYYISVNITSHSIYPASSEVPSIIRLYLSAQNSASVWANITLPNGTINKLTLSNGNYGYYDAAIVGTYNVIFYANDSLGASASVADSFVITEEAETIIVTTTTGGGGGGGGGVAMAPSTPKYSISLEELQVKLKQGETTTKSFKITNRDNKNINLRIVDKDLEGLVIINETTISLEPGESKTINMDFLAREDTIPNLYLGRIIVSSEGTEKDILVLMEIESKEALFDIKLKIPNKYNYVLPGEEVSAQIQLYNLGYSGRMDVYVDYIIKDIRGEDIILEQDSIAIETSISFIKEIQIPKNLPFGKYIFYVRVTYNDKIASASSNFNIGKGPTIPLKLGLIVLAIVLLIGAIITVITFRKIKKHSTALEKVDIDSLKRARLIK